MLGGPDFLMQILKLIFLIKNQCNVTETKKNTIRKMHIHCGQLILRKISKNWCHQTSAGTLPQTLLGELTVLLQIPRLYFMDLLKTSKGEGREGDERVEGLTPHFSLPSVASPLHTITNRENFHFKVSNRLSTTSAGFY